MINYSDCDIVKVREIPLGLTIGSSLLAVLPLPRFCFDFLFFIFEEEEVPNSLSLVTATARASPERLDLDEPPRVRRLRRHLALITWAPIGHF